MATSFTLLQIGLATLEFKYKAGWSLIMEVIQEEVSEKGVRYGVYLSEAAEKKMTPFVNDALCSPQDTTQQCFGSFVSKNISH